MRAKVTFKNIPGLPSYRVGSDGSVWSLKTERLLACVRENASGYFVVTLYRRGSGKVVRRLHHLVLEAFVGPRPPGMEACHNDDDRTNNALCNLRWGTRLENAADRVRNRRTGAKVTDEQVVEIREEAARGTPQKILAGKFGVGANHISRIVRRTHRKHVV